MTASGSDPFVPPSSYKNLHSQKSFASRICSITSNCYRSGCSHPCVDPHHLCTDTAALYTAVSEVAFLVQNRLSPYITFCRLHSVSRFVTEDTLRITEYISILLIREPPPGPALHKSPLPNTSPGSFSTSGRTSPTPPQASLCPLWSLYDTFFVASPH